MWETHHLWLDDLKWTRKEDALDSVIEEHRRDPYHRLVLDRPDLLVIATDYALWVYVKEKEVK